MPISVPLDTGILNSLLDPINGLLSCVSNLLRCRGRLVSGAEVGPDEESGKEPCEGCQVDDVERNGERLTWSIEAWDVFVFLVEMMFARGCVNGIGRDRVRVRDEEGEECRAAADEELSDLHRCQGLFDGFRDSDGEGGNGVVCVLQRRQDVFADSARVRLTINA